MKKSKNLLFGLAVLLITFNANSQQRDTGPQSSAFSNNLDQFGIQLADKILNSNTLDDVKGSHYLFSDWKMGLATFNINGKNITVQIPCNYNLVSKEVEVKVSEGEIYALNENSLNNLIIDQKKYIISNQFKNNPLVELIGSTKDTYYYVKKFDIEIQNVPTKTLGLHENKFVKKESEYIISKSTPIKYKNKYLKKIKNKSNKIRTKNTIQKNLDLLNNINNI